MHWLLLEWLIINSLSAVESVLPYLGFKESSLSVNKLYLFQGKIKKIINLHIGSTFCVFFRHSIKLIRYTMQYLNISKKFLKEFKFLILAIIFISSCKKEKNNSGLELPTPNTINSELYQQLFQYNQNHPIIDSITAVGAIDWGKVVVRFSSDNSKPVNFDLPIVNGANECSRVLEFSFTNDKQLVAIKTRTFNSLAIDTSLEKPQPRSENARTLDILYQLSMQGLKINTSIINFEKRKEIFFANQARQHFLSKNSASIGGHLPQTNGFSYEFGDCGTFVDFDFLMTFHSMGSSATSSDMNLAFAFSVAFWKRMSASATRIQTNSTGGNLVRLFIPNWRDVNGDLGEYIKTCLRLASEDMVVNYGYDYYEFMYFYYTATSDCTPNNGVVETGGEGVDAPSAISQDVVNNVENPCLKSMVDATVNADISTQINNLIQGVFGTSTSLNIKFIDVTTLPDYVDGYTVPDLVVGTNGSINLTIQLNQNTMPHYSQEYIARVIMHEAIHAYMIANDIPLAAQHEDMIVNYTTRMAASLQQMFPNLSEGDAKRLSLGGLWMTPTYTNTIANDMGLSGSVDATLLAYSIGPNGIRCN